VAVSGGGDSVALLALAARWGGDHGRAVLAATTDHGLRPEARDEAAAVQALCARLGVKHRILAPGGVPDRGNLSANLRDVRYAALAAWAARHGIGQVLLGHTEDDQAETVLMRLGRGAGVDGLAGMEACRTWQGVAWIRPLLEVRRAALRDWLRAEGMDWIDDPTNEDAAFERVRVRRALAVLAPLGITVEGLSDTADLLRGQRAVLEDAASALERAAALPAPPGEVWLDRRMLREAAEDTGLRILARSLARVGGRMHRPRQRSLGPLHARLRSSESFRATLAGCLISARADVAEVRIRREAAAGRTH